MELEAGGGCLVDGNGRSMEQLILPKFSRLRDLRIRLCPSMTYFPSCPNVKQLELKGVNEVFCMKGSALTNPSASDSSNSSDPNSGLEKLIVPSAVDIDINYFFREESLKAAGEGFQRCAASLRHLSINGFYKMKSLSEGGIEQLTNLQSLTIKECFVLDLEKFKVEEEERGMPWKSLHSLSTLRLDDFPKLVNLPMGFQYLTALRFLHIKSCSNLEALGECVRFLTSLQSLHIEDCNKLKTLPECLGSLSSLQSIRVDECNNLEALPECLDSLLS